MPVEIETGRKGSRVCAASTDLAPSGDSDFAKLESRLLGLSGRRVVLVPPEPHLEAILCRGRVFAPERLRMRRGEPHRCHGNAARLWYDSGGSISIATGYANAGGRWIQHSWGVDGERVVETTCRFGLYFGVLLTTREALKFSFDNAPDLAERIPGDFSRGRAFPALVREVEEISAKLENSSKSGRCRSTDLNARFTADSW